MSRWMIGTVAVFMIIFAITAIATGSPEFLIPTGILAVLVVGYSLFNRGLEKKVEANAGGAGAAVADSDEPIPSTHVAGDDRPPGDTPEAHDEINPHDLPPDHPGRQEAERQADGEAGTTPGDRDGGSTA